MATDLLPRRRSVATGTTGTLCQVVAVVRPAIAAAINGGAVVALR
jgi:hypothetical protein